MTVVIGRDLTSTESEQVAPQPPKPEIWIERYCAGCGKFIDQVRAQVGTPNPTHGQCKDCEKALYRSNVATKVTDGDVKATVSNGGKTKVSA